MAKARFHALSGMMRGAFGRTHSIAEYHFGAIRRLRPRGSLASEPRRKLRSRAGLRCGARLDLAPDRIASYWRDCLHIAMAAANLCPRSLGKA